MTYPKLFSTFLLFLTAVAPIWTQHHVFDVTATSSSSETAVHFADQDNLLTSFTVEYNDPLMAEELESWGVCSWESMGTACTSPTTVSSTTHNVSTSGLQVRFDDDEAVVEVVSGTEPDAGIYFVNLQMNFVGGGFNRKLLRIIVRPAIAMVFVLDRSGSMECGPNEPGGPIGWEDCADEPNDKWSMLENSLDVFMSNTTFAGSYTNVAEDGFNIVYFDGIEHASGLGAGFVDRATFTTGVGTNLSGQKNSEGKLGRNGTSYGAGIKEAIVSNFNGLINVRQVVVLITDGVQNRNPMLSTAEQIDDATSTSTRLDADDEGIEYFCLALDHRSGMPGIVPQLLSDLAGVSSKSLVDNGASATSATPLIEELIDQIYSSNSPQNIDSRFNVLDSVQVSETYTVNEGGSSLRFSAHFTDASARDYDYFISREGVDLTELSDLRWRGSTAAVTLDLLRHPEINSGGEWKFTVRYRFQDGEFNSNRRQIVAYPSVVMNAVIDEPQLDVVYSMGGGRLEVNDNLLPRVQLTVGDRGIENATVKVRLVRPGADKGDLIARAEDIPYQPETNSEVNNPFSVKYNYLQRNNPDYLAPLKLVENTFPLVHQGDGLYTANLGKAEVADAYQLYYTIEATDADLGQIVRNKRQTEVARFGELSDNLSPRSITTFQENGVYFHRLTYTPTYVVNGTERLVGPGYASVFSVEHTGETELSGVVDNGDGSYTLLIQSSEQSPRTTIKLLDEPILEDRPLQEFGGEVSNYNFHISAHAGITTPFGILDSTYNVGTFAEIDLGFQLAPKLELELIGGYYNFDPDFTIVGGSGNLRYSFLPTGGGSAMGLSLSAGAGYYKPDSESGSIGFNGRVGIQQRFGQRLSLSVEGGYFYLPDPDYQWGTLGVALRYGF